MLGNVWLTLIIKHDGEERESKLSFMIELFNHKQLEKCSEENFIIISIMREFELRVYKY